MVLPEVRHWKLVESYRLQTLCECRERRRGNPAVVNSGKITVLEKTLAGMGNDEPILAGKKVLEKELEKLQKKLNGPKKTAKHIGAKQNWINRQQMSCKMGNCVEFPLAPQIIAVAHRKDYDVAGFPLELECLDDDQGTERQNRELERENGGECCWSEKAARNGAGTVVETLAQDWSSMDREMQYERTGGHQRSYAQLGWTCGKAGLQRNLCEGSEMSRPSMVAMETAQLERGGERQMVWPTPTTVQNLQVGGHGCW